MRTILRKFGLAAMALAMITLVSAQRAQAQYYNDHDTTWRQVGSFDHFLDRHPDIQRELNQHPGLVNDPRYVRSHPQLANYLYRHPAVRHEIRENPRAFMRNERRWERAEWRRGRGDWDNRGWRRGRP